jgi:hypothetical protein
LTLFRRLLALGAALLRLCFVTRAAVRPSEPVTAQGGVCWASHDQRPTPYDSVFGTVRFWRHASTAPGQAGRCPLDAALRLPAHWYSALLRAWAASGTTDASSRESQTGLERILGVSLSVQTLATCVADDAGDVATFYDPPAVPTALPTVGTMLVVQADGQGGPMVASQPAPEAPPVRLGKGQQRTKKQEAVVTGLSTIAPYRRTPEEGVAALLRDSSHTGAAARPVPVGKDLRATLEGKQVAMTRLVERVAQRDTLPMQQRVALSDGAEALQQPFLTHFPQYTLVLDIIHATAYLWDAANALLGETHAGRTAWVRGHLEQRLAGHTEALLTALEAEAQGPTGTATPRQTVLRTVGYTQRNRPYRHDDQYLACGWPMGTGVIEGACGPLVKDRMEQAGRRWTKAGAQAVLDLRAVRIHSHWDAYWPFHRQQQPQRLYGAATPASEPAEAQVLALAA